MKVTEQVKQLLNEADSLKDTGFGFGDQATANFIYNIHQLLDETGRQIPEITKFADMFFTTPRDHWGLLTEMIIIELKTVGKDLAEAIDYDNEHVEDDDDDEE